MLICAMPSDDSFFLLKNFENCKPLAKKEDFLALFKGDSGEISDYFCKFDELSNNKESRVPQIENITFKNVSFKGVEFVGIVFLNCHFQNCRFHWASFKGCRFHNCSFEATNMHKIKIEKTFVDPHYFLDATPDKLKYPNIGLHLFQTLMRNSRDEDQPTWESRARYQFKRWQRYEQLNELKRLKAAKKANNKHLCELRLSIWGNHIWGTLFGYGVRLRNYTITTFIVITVLTLLNWFFADSFGLTLSPEMPKNLVEVLYFTVISLTTVGYGDFAPTTEMGRLFAVFQALIGFVLFGVLISMLYRKISA